MFLFEQRRIASVASPGPPDKQCARTVEGIDLAQIPFERRVGGNGFECPEQASDRRLQLRQSPIAGKRDDSLAGFGGLELHRFSEHQPPRARNLPTSHRGKENLMDSRRSSVGIL